MGWMYCYNKIKKLIESEEFQKENALWNPGDNHQRAVAIALGKLYDEYNPWGHKL